MMSSSVCSLGILVPTPTLILSQSWTQIWAPTSFPWRTHFKKVCHVEARAGGFQGRWRHWRMNCICHTVGSHKIHLRKRRRKRKDFFPRLLALIPTQPDFSREVSARNFSPPPRLWRPAVTQEALKLRRWSLVGTVSAATGPAEWRSQISWTRRPAEDRGWVEEEEEELRSASTLLRLSPRPISQSARPDQPLAALTGRLLLFCFNRFKLRVILLASCLLKNL